MVNGTWVKAKGQRLKDESFAESYVTGNVVIPAKAGIQNIRS